jgi:hypothetical protein
VFSALDYLVNDLGQQNNLALSQIKNEHPAKVI